MVLRLSILLLFVVGIRAGAFSQNLSAGPDSLNEGQVKLFSFDPAPTLHKGRVRLGVGVTSVAFTGTALIFWQAYYKNFQQTTLHTFNDWGEWNHMDKAGHLSAAYCESVYAFRGARWAGLDRKTSLWIAIGIGSGVQATMELMDGFSKKWGFSVSDIGFNTLGVGIFAAQELAWKEQRIMMKISGIRPNYDKSPIYSEDGDAVTTLDERAAFLYGTSPVHTLLKDYNALAFWASFNLRSFSRDRETAKVPAWLNLAVGYGAQNLYGGFNNEWTTPEGAHFSIDREKYPRYRQFFLSPDLDFRKIPTRHKWLKFTLSLFNYLKIPAPTLEINTLGKLKFHPLYF